jgi:hypothetical protein
MPDPENKKPDKQPDVKPPDVKPVSTRKPVDNFVSKIVTDPATPPELTRVTGYPGASTEDGHTRLYLNPELSAYLDIPEADIVYEQSVPNTTDPLGAVIWWIKQDSKTIPHVGQG